MERCTLDENGFLGVYYPGTISPEKAIILVGGGLCDEPTSISMSGYLRKAGYNVLVLGFYIWEGLSKELVSVPVDYVEKAIHWLKTTKPPISKIAMTGVSTGAGYTLLSASLIPDIGCIIPVVPFDYVMEGATLSLKRFGKSVYTWHGQDVPYSPWSITDQGHFKLFWNLFRDPNYGIFQFLRYCYDHNEMLEESRIKIEQMHAEVLFLAVEKDEGWPSSEAVERMLKVLKDANYPYRVEYKIYEKASHALVDGIDEIKGFTRWIFKNMLKAEKNYPKECEEARQDSFKRVLEFLEQWN